MTQGQQAPGLWSSCGSVSSTLTMFTNITTEALAIADSQCTIELKPALRSTACRLEQGHGERLLKQMCHLRHVNIKCLHQEQ